MNNAKLIDQLNNFLADSTVLYEKLHAFHWYVQGRQFFALHNAFEGYYDKWNEVIDEVAERILTIGGKPLAKLSDVLKNASIEEYNGTLDSVEMVATVQADFEHMIKAADETIAIAEEVGDRGSANLLDGLCDELEKSVWMLKAWRNE